MKCKQCNNDLIIASSKLESMIDSTDVYSVQKLVCTNAKCPMFCGNNLSDPSLIVETIRNKV